MNYMEFNENYSTCPVCNISYTEHGKETNIEKKETRNYRYCITISECFWSHTWECGTPEPEPNY